MADWISIKTFTMVCIIEETTLIYNIRWWTLGDKVVCIISLITKEDMVKIKNKELVINIEIEDLVMVHHLEILMETLNH